MDQSVICFLLFDIPYNLLILKTLIVQCVNYVLPRIKLVLQRIMMELPKLKLTF